MKRRRLRAPVATAFGVCLLLALSYHQIRSEDSPRPVAFHTQTMGTWASLTVVTADSAATAGIAFDALTRFHYVDSLMSNWTDVSEVARINRNAARYEITVHPEVAGVLAFARQVAAQTNGAFDVTVEPLVRLWGFIGGQPRVPTQAQIDTALALVGQEKVRFDANARTLHFTRDGVKVDLGGIAKGYAVDRAAEIVRQAGVTDALLDLSGNMVAIGNAATHDGWWVGIRDPSGAHSHLARLRLHDEAVATSGNYEQFIDTDGQRYGHILDPRTGWSARGLSSVTVVTRQAVVADAWATALFVLGPAEARRMAHGLEDLDVVLIEPVDDGKNIIWVEERLRSRFELREGLETSHSVRYF